MRVLLLFLLFFIFGLVWVFTFQTSPLVIPENFDYSRERATLATLFTKQGVEAAIKYYLLLDGVASRTHDAEKVRIAHDLAHFIGDELYKKKGVDGVILCNGDSGFGCYHGFFARAMSREGKDFISLAETTCRSQGDESKQFNGCVHGLGHGLIALEGYAFENVQKALSDCDTLTTPLGRKGCYSGVFMEYNNQQFHLYIGKEAVVRPLDRAHPYDPCISLSSTYQWDCYYEQPNWWRGAVDHDFLLMGEWCNQIPQEENRDACFTGLGRVQPLDTQYNLAFMGKNCNTMPTPRGTILCINEAVRLLATLTKEHTLDPKGLCAYLLGEERKSCEIQADQYLHQ